MLHVAEFLSVPGLPGIEWGGGGGGGMRLGVEGDMQWAPGSLFPPLPIPTSQM